jgi:hypothetical protein
MELTGTIQLPLGMLGGYLSDIRVLGRVDARISVFHSSVPHNIVAWRDSSWDCGL